MSLQIFRNFVAENFLEETQERDDIQIVLPTEQVGKCEMLAFNEVSQKFHFEWFNRNAREERAKTRSL